MVTQPMGKSVKHMSITHAVVHEGMDGAGLLAVIISESVGFDVVTARGFHSTVTPRPRTKAVFDAPRLIAG